MPVAAPVVTLEELKEFLQIPSTSTGRDDRLTLIANGVNAFLAMKTGRDLRSATRTQRLAGTGTRTMVLRHYPITSVTSITEDGTAIDATLTTEVEILDERGILIRVNGVWQRTIERIYTVIYVAGPKPDDYGDLQFAGIQMAAWVHRTSGVGSIERFSGRGHEVFRSSLSRLPGVREVIEQWSDSARGFMGGSLIA